MRDRNPTTLGDLATLTMGQSPPSDSINTDETGLPFLQGCAEFGAISPRARMYCSPVLRAAYARATLISVRAPVGTMNLADQAYAIGRGLAAITAKVNLADNTFLRCAVEHGMAHLHRRSQGSTFPAVGSYDLRCMPIPAFDLTSQRRIGEILSTLDEAIAQTEALIAKTQAIKAGLMKDLFTRGVTANGELRPPREEAPQLYKPSPLGWIPKEWRVSSFGTCLLGSPQNGLYKPATEYVDSGTSIVRIDSFYDGAIQNLAGLKRVRLIPTERALYGLAEGDILINRVNSLDYVGKSAIVPELHEALVFESNMMRCRVNQAVISPQFAIRWLCAPLALQHFQSRAKSAVAQASINQADVRSLPVKLPDAAEQQRIFERVSAIEATIRCERENHRELLGLKQGLMHDLLTGRVPVPLPEPAALAADA